MSVATGAERPVLVVADRIALGGDTGPVVGGVAQPVVGRLSPCHEHALTRTAGDWSHPAETAKCVVVPSPRTASLPSASSVASTLLPMPGNDSRMAASGGFVDEGSSSVDAFGSSVGAASAS